MDISSQEALFRSNLIHLRKNKKWSQEELAAKSGLDRTYISMIERGKRSPTITTIFKLCDALGCAPNQAFKGIINAKE